MTEDQRFRSQIFSTFCICVCILGGLALVGWTITRSIEVGYKPGQLWVEEFRAAHQVK